MKKKILIAIVFGIIGFWANMVCAAILFEDDFNSENGGAPTLNYSGFINWDLTDGSVDLIGNGYYDFYPDEGLYIDLDGSTSNAGRLESKVTFELNPGIYVLEFDLAGHSSRGPNTLNISIGSVFEESITSTETNSVLTTYSHSFNVLEAATGKITFDHSGGDNQGITLDNVSLSSEVPIPSGVWLLCTGLIGLVGIRSKLKK